MLIDWIEKIRGIDRWPVATAEVTSAPMRRETNKGQPSGWSSRLRIEWRDRSGVTQKASFQVPDGSPLFQLYRGQTLSIRYKPSDPAAFYIRQQFLYRAFQWLVGLLLGMIALALIVGLTWLKAHGLK